MSEEISGGLEQAIARARGFIADTPGMKAEPESMSVPPEAREAFYQLVERAQDALLDELGQGGVARAQTAAAGLAQVRDGIVAASDLTSLNLPQAVETYLDDARASLRKPLFGVVMDVLSGAGSVEAARDVAAPLLARHAATMYRCAIELQAYLGIVAALRARYPDMAIIATGGPTDESILATIGAGANAITYTPPSSASLFAKTMADNRSELE